MKFKCCYPLTAAAALAASVVTLLAANSDVEWDNGAGNNDWSNPTNWSANALPHTGLGTTGDRIHINLGGANRARFTAADASKTYQRLFLGDATSGAELEVTGGTLITDGTSSTRIATGGRTATLNQTSGAVGLGGYLQVGLDANSVGNINLSGGTLVSSRNGTVGGIAGVSLVLGDGNNAQGKFVLSGGEFRTRSGVLLGNPATTGKGRFEVRGAGIATLGAENADTDGFWVQGAGSTLAAYVEDGALGIIFVDDRGTAATGTYNDGNVIFAPGALLEVGFIGAPTPGTWDLMKWEGTLLTNGLAFAPGVTDTNWSFAVVDTDGVNGPDTLRLSYGTPAPTPFIHPGGMHTAADFARMRTKVAAGAQPWLDGWNKLLANSHAQLSWTPNPQPIIYRGFDGTNPENYGTLYNDIAAAYQCALRYHVSGDPNYANKAVQIMNAWATTLTNISGTSDRFLASGIYGYQFANVGEMMSRYSGWKHADKAAFRSLMLNVFYPMNRDFLRYHNFSCLSHYWANWDLCNMASLISIAVLCDDPAMFEEAVGYFKNGPGNGAIGNAVYYVHPGRLGQWQESGRDQGHNTLGIALMGPLCEVAWNQGVDLYGYAGNRFLSGCEYIAQYNLFNEVPYAPYNNCDNVNQLVISTNGRGTLRACWEMVYNHYVNRMGLAAPYTAQITALARPEGGGGDYGPNSGGYDQLGFGTLTYTREASGATPPAIPAAPAGLAANLGACGVDLAWKAVAGAASYNVMRAEVSGGPYTTLVALEVAGTNFTDLTAVSGVPYYYVVSANNAGGESAFSNEAGTAVAPAGLPSPWSRLDVGVVGTAGGTDFCAVSNRFILRGAGSNVGGASDSMHFAHLSLPGDGEIIARLASLATGGTVDDKVGLMVRATTNANARNYSLFIDANVNWTVRATYRSSTGGSTTTGTTGPQVYPPLWLKLVRSNSGNDFSSHYSYDGVSWTLLDTRTLSGWGMVQIGVFVCSRDTNALNTSVFDNVALAGIWPASVATNPVPLTATVAGGSLQFSWPATHTGWRLETQTNSRAVGLGTNWFTVPGTSATNQMTLPVNPADPAVFFRLTYP